MAKDIIQISASFTRVGDMSIPTVFALTDNGEVYRFDPSRKGHDPRWTKLPEIADDDQDETLDS